MSVTLATRTVTIHATHFLEDDIVDGDYPRDDVRTTVYDCDDTDDAVRVLEREGLSFAATGNDWAADPDGSYISNYATGERVETSGHLSGWSEAETNEIMERVG